MPDPADLLAIARALLAPGKAGHVSEASLRRAVSTAYYALFHAVLRAGAGRFVGAPGSAGYSLVYRGFQHGRMKNVCEMLNVKRLNPSLRMQLGRESASQDMRDFASAFAALQESRHLADYDPDVRFLPSDAAGLVDAADDAMAAFERVPADERSDVLALMLVNPRG